MLNFPEWCIYLETTNLYIQSLQPYGMFILVNYNPPEGFFLRIGVDLGEEILDVDFPLNSDMTYRVALEDELSIRKTKSDFGFDKSKCGDYIEIDLDDFVTEVIKYVIPRLQYICSKNRDIKNISHPGQPIRRASFLNNGKWPKISCAQNYSEILVGGDIKKIYYDKSNIYFSVNADGSFEANHNDLKSSKEMLQSEFESIDLLSQIRALVENLDNDIEKLKNKIESLEEDNLTLFKEGIKYCTELSRNEIELRQQKEEYEQICSRYQIALSEIDSLKLSLRKRSENILSRFGAIADGPKLNLVQNILRNKIVLNRELSLPESLRLIEALYPERITVLPDAWESAEQISKTFHNKEKFTRDVFLLATDFYEKYLAGGGNSAKIVFGTRYSARESETVMNSKLKKCRRFSGYEMMPHLKISYSERLYFMFDVKLKRIFIGYCGRHLPISSL